VAIIAACSFGWWLVLICSERKVLLAGCWFVVREKYYWLISQANRAHSNQAQKHHSEWSEKANKLVPLPRTTASTKQGKQVLARPHCLGFKFEQKHREGASRR
jgi:hypothetical protein